MLSLTADESSSPCKELVVRSDFRGKKELEMDEGYLGHEAIVGRLYVALQATGDLLGCGEAREQSLEPSGLMVEGSRDLFFSYH